jgi:hypothetical protein
LCDGFWIWALYDYQWLSQACLRLLFLAYRRPILVQGCYWGTHGKPNVFGLWFASLFQISISSSINGSRLCTCIACGHVCHVLWEQMVPNICMHTCVIYLNIYLFIYLLIYISFFPRIISCTYININIYIHIMYSFVGYQVILAEYFPAPHLDRSAPGQSRTSSPALHTKTSDQTQMPWRQVAAVPSLSLCIRIYIYTVQACNLV